MLQHASARVLISVRARLDIPQYKPVRCNNTVQGRWLTTDSTGVVCTRDDLNYATGCCNRGEQHSCQTCGANQCCREFEYCVSCCLSPQITPAVQLSMLYRAADRPETGQWPTVFDYCRGKCRTSSRSTVHENAYLSPHHHCFSPSGKPTTPSPPLPALPGDVQALPGEKGQSCTVVCETAGKKCLPGALASLNDCNVLRQHFACEAGCQGGSAAELPSYVISAAPKAQLPTICLVHTVAQAEFSCEGNQANSQRLCACGPASS